MFRFVLFAIALVAAACATAYVAHQVASASRATAFDDDAAAFRLPRELAWFQEERDCEIIHAKLTVADAAQQLLNAVQTYRGERSRYDWEFASAQVNNPMRAALQQPAILPRRVDDVRHLAEIRTAAGEFLNAFHWFEAEVERINARYRDEASALIGADRFDSHHLLLPAADCDAVITEAILMMERWPHVLD